MKKLLHIIFSITFLFPMIKDGNVMYNANYVMKMWQNNNFVFMQFANGDNTASLSFDAPSEAIRFVDCYADWLAQQGK